jgi:hypothetical protein
MCTHSNEHTYAHARHIALSTHASAAVEAVLAVAVPKFRFEQELQGAFEVAMGAACGGRAEVVGVADKPHGFRGGGALPPRHGAHIPSDCRFRAFCSPAEPERTTERES